MTFTTKMTAASLIALMAGAASAQSVSGDAGANVGAGAGVEVGDTVDGSLNANAGANVGADISTDGTLGGTVSGVVATGADISAEAQAMLDNISGTVVVANDAVVIGTVESAELRTDGTVAYTVALDAGLGLETERVVFVADLTTDTDGEITVDMTGEEFAAAVMSSLEAAGETEVTFD